jgi:tRNA A37 methylthiotransferase MiaB
VVGFHIEHFGCRAARADGEAIAANLRAMSQLEPLAADVVIVNTCSVTAEADRAARAFIRRAHRRNPAAKIVVTGCYAQRAPEELAAMAGVAAVVGNSHKALAPEIILKLTREAELPRGAELAGGAVRIPSAASPVPKCEGPGASSIGQSRLLPVASLLAGSARQFSMGAELAPLATPTLAPIWADDRFAHSFVEDVHWGEMQSATGAQTRPNLKIQEGCGNRCTFCVIPLTRGASQSLPYAVVMRQVESFVAAGGKELVLSGINLGRWGRDLVVRDEALWVPTFSAEKSGKDGAREIVKELNWFPTLGNSQRARITKDGATSTAVPFAVLAREIVKEQSWSPTLGNSQRARITKDGATSAAVPFAVLVREIVKELSWSPTLGNSQRARITKDGATSAAPTSLAALVRNILEESALPRLRLSSIEPMDWDDGLIALLREFGGGRLARHAHLPLQSGSDAVLRRMHRRYRPWHYAEKVRALVDAAGPDLTLGADVMVGFPGETDGEFEETLAFIRALPFGYLHLFPFSPRPGTALHAAAKLAPAVMAERMAALRALAAEKSEAHRRQFVGRTLEAITLHTPAALAEQGRTTALTENYLPVELDGGFAANQLVRIRVRAINADGALECEAAPAEAAQ